MPLDFNQLRELLAAIAQSDIAELTLKTADFELTVRKGTYPLPPLDPPPERSSGAATAEFRGTPVDAAASPKPPAPTLQAPLTVPSMPTPPAVDPKWEEIKSPMVGTFYRAPGPDETPYVNVGDRIRVGQTVCIIEAMKLMNEIEAEASGQIMEILLESGDSVEYGQPLMRINPEQ